MGTRGPIPKSAKLHVLKGNPSKIPEHKLLAEFHPEVEIPECPAHLWEEGKIEWDRITVELEANNLISKCDRAALALYCQAWARLVWLEVQFSLSLGLAMDNAKGIIAETGEQKALDLKTSEGGLPGDNFLVSPYWPAIRQCTEQVEKYIVSFGLSPINRARVRPSLRGKVPRDGVVSRSTQEKQTKTKDKWGDL